MYLNAVSTVVTKRTLCATPLLISGKFTYLSTNPFIIFNVVLLIRYQVIHLSSALK